MVETPVVARIGGGGPVPVKRGGMAEVLVAGAGAAGMMAALAASARGARVRLVERDLAEPSTLVLSGGLFAAAGTRWQAEAGIADGPARFAEDVIAFTRGTAHRGVLATVTGASGRAAAFLAEAAGLPIHLHTASRWPGHSVPRLHATPAESGAELSALLRAAVARDARIRLEDGTELLGLSAAGAELSQAGSRRGVAVDAVILATGGFGGAPDLLACHAPAAAGAAHVGGRHATGTALRIGLAQGAAIACLDAYQGQPHVSPHLVAGVRPRFGAALPALGAVLVNRHGERFAPEDMGPSELTAHLLAQPGGVAVEIWDAAAQQGAMAGGPFRRAVELGVVARCDSIADLAARFALPADVLAATLEHAARCAGGEVRDALGRTRWGAPLAPPFHAAEVTGALAHTQGGLVVDGAARVLRADGSVVPRLYAAGGAACGISGDGAAGYVPGNGLAQSFALGLLAGEHAAR
jgi:fumarate reductase flavoprotein subunit